ncbi:MAG: AbrB/MazE/SpoVT family DNA-binding domain-containing protein [Ardenticatenia bacterium]|nr:AbrB/MazE/SpoVT family DNA-binding domain-containing protein [Ardenticatenia bacterium]
MRITIDGAGRLVLPKSIRESAGLYAGAEIEVNLRDGDVIELHPAPRSVRVEKRGHLYVGVPVDASPELSEEVVQATLDTLRSERLLDQWGVDSKP